MLTKRLPISASLLAALPAIAAIAVVGCSGSNSGSSTGDGGTPGTDSGAAADAGDAATTPGTDGGGSADASGNPPLPDGSILPHGNLLAPEGTSAFFINGVTSDDYVVYTDTAANTVYAVSLAAGSKPITLATADANDDVNVVGKVVFIGTSSDKNGVGAALVWTSASTAPTQLSTATYVSQGGLFYVSADGAHVLFIDDVNTAETVGSIVVSAPDGTGKVTLVPSVDVNFGDCFPSLAFGGTYAVAAYCEVAGGAGGGGDGGSDGGEDAGVGDTSATVSSFAGTSSWARATIATNVSDSFAVDPGGTKVVVNNGAGTTAYPIAGGAPLLIDANGELGDETGSPGLLTNDGSHLVYTTNANGLERAATTSPASPTQLAAAGTFSDVFFLSPDTNQSWVVGMLDENPTGNGTDLYLASALTASTPITLTTDVTSEFQGDPFTLDASHVLFFSAVGSQSGYAIGTFNATAVSGTGAPRVLGTNGVEDFATSGTKVVFNSNFNSTTGGADLQAADTALTTSPTLLVTQADPTFFLNAEKTMIIYTWSYQPGPSAGLWAMSAP